MGPLPTNPQVSQPTGPGGSGSAPVAEVQTHTAQWRMPTRQSARDFRAHSVFP